MRITKSKLRRIIKESLLNEDRADRLTLWLRPDSRGDELELYVNESDTTYDLSKYIDGGGLDTLLKDFEADHGMPMPPGTMVIDYDGIGMDDLPIEQAFDWVVEAYTSM